MCLISLERIAQTRVWRVHRQRVRACPRSPLPPPFCSYIHLHKCRCTLIPFCNLKQLLINIFNLLPVWTFEFLTVRASKEGRYCTSLDFKFQNMTLYETLWNKEQPASSEQHLFNRWGFIQPTKLPRVDFGWRCVSPSPPSLCYRRGQSDITRVDIWFGGWSFFAWSVKSVTCHRRVPLVVMSN
jgi:hypothetical protein